MDFPELCLICRHALLSTPLERDRKACDDCARRTGLIAMGPPRRRVAPCSKCNHGKLVRFVPRELTTIRTREGYVASYGPMFATYPPPGVFETTIHPRSGFGVLEGYACRSCGFIEWYCQDPTEIPIGPEYMTEEIDVAGPTPYR
jgi:hypothetical protein